MVIAMSNASATATVFFAREFGCRICSRRRTMSKLADFLFILTVTAVLALAAPISESVVEGTVKKIDAGLKTVIVKTADGTEQTFHFTDREAVYGVEGTRSGSRKTLQGLE
jgi:hypothetical protein